MAGRIHTEEMAGSGVKTWTDSIMLLAFISPPFPNVTQQTEEDDAAGVTSDTLGKKEGIS